jgi:hypothetical protein
MLRIVFLISFLFLNACATGYVSRENGVDFGYKVEKLGTEFFYTHIASYYGNAQTTKPKAKAYTEMAAIDHCADVNLLPILMRDPIDLTKSYRGTSVNSIGNQVYSYPTVRTFPAYMTFFRCDKDYKVFNQNPILKELSAQLIKDYVEDFKGGVQVVALDEKSKEGGLKVNDVIIEVSGVRTVNKLSIYSAIALASRNAEALDVLVLRNKSKKKLKLGLASRLKDNMEVIRGKVRSYCEVTNMVYSERIEPCVSKNMRKMIF